MYEMYDSIVFTVNYIIAPFKGQLHFKMARLKDNTLSHFVPPAIKLDLWRLILPFESPPHILPPSL